MTNIYYIFKSNRGIKKNNQMNENNHFCVLIDKLKLQKKNIEKYKKMLNYITIYTIYYIT